MLVLLIMLKYTFLISTPINALSVIAMFVHKANFLTCYIGSPHRCCPFICSHLYNHVWDHHHLPSTVRVLNISHLSSLFCETIYICISCMSSGIVLLYFVISFMGGCHESDSWESFDNLPLFEENNNYYYYHKINSGFKIAKNRNLYPCGLGTSTLPLGHGGSPQYCEWAWRKFSFFETWMPKCGTNPRSPTFQADSFNHCTRDPAPGRVGIVNVLWYSSSKWNLNVSVMDSKTICNQ